MAVGLSLMIIGLLVDWIVTLSGLPGLIDSYF